MSDTVRPNAKAELEAMLRQLRLPSFSACYEPMATKAGSQGWTFAKFLFSLCEQEVLDREHRKIARLARRSNLPDNKRLSTLRLDRLPAPVRTQLPALCDGGFVERAVNLLLFGLPGRGKTHVAAAIGHELVSRGYAVYFTETFKLVQRLLAAKRDLVLEKELKRLDAFDLIICDDIGYVQQDRDEMEVFFTFLAERYERKSLAITSNLVFSQWTRIFKDEMTAAAAIDRLVHHSVIIEATGNSYRADSASSAATSNESAEDTHGQKGDMNKGTGQRHDEDEVRAQK